MCLNVQNLFFKRRKFLLEFTYLNMSGYLSGMPLECQSALDPDQARHFVEPGPGPLFATGS